MDLRPQAVSTSPLALLWPAETPPAGVLPMPRAARPDTQPAQAPLHALRGARRASVLADIPAPLAEAFEASGGLIADDELAALLGRSAGQPLSRLARWILNREVVCIPWQLQSVLPMFQFDTRDMSLRPEVVEVVAELSGALDDWDVAIWFATPTSWLEGATPVDAMGVEPASVLQAARADRFIARG